jgi:hypothetical protein
MVRDLDSACQQSADPPSAPSLVVARRVQTGQRGRPKVEIDRVFLEQALELRGPTDIAPLLGCSPRTVRRRALDHQLVEPAPSVITTSAQADGTVVRTWSSSTRPVANLSDDQLDSFVRAILEVCRHTFYAKQYLIPLCRLSPALVAV